MQKNQLFTVILVTISLAFISFSEPTNTPSTESLNKVDIVTDNSSSYKSEPVSMSTELYEGLKLDEKGLSKETLDYAIKGYEKLLAKGVVKNNQYITIVDFSQTSRKKRFYLLDVKNNKLVHNTFVSHGKNTGVDVAEKFSNKINSEQSSLGFYVTTETYTGKHGLSMRLAGQEKDFNDNAEARGIVVHGAAYVNANRVNSPFMGRSQGCPALPEAEYAKVINIIKGGSVMFIYSPDENYLQESQLLNG
jgi:hypothetical protein